MHQIIDTKNFSFDIGVPYLVHLNNNHYVVVIKLKKIIVFDPGRGKYSISEQNLLKIMTGYYIFVTPKEDFQKTKNNKHEFRHLIPIIKETAGILFLVFLVSLFTHGFSLFFPVVLRNVINLLSIDARNLSDPIKILIWGVLAFFALSLYQSKIFVDFQIRLSSLLNKRIVTHLFNIKYAFFDNRSSGNVIFRIGLLNQIQTIISGSIISIFTTFTGTVGIIVFLALVYKNILIYILLPITVLIIILYVFNKKLLKLSREEIRSKEEVDSLLTELVQKMETIKYIDFNNIFLNKYQINYDNYLLLFRRSRKYGYYYTVLLNGIIPTIPIILIIFILLKTKILVGDIFVVYALMNNVLGLISQTGIELSKINMLRANLFYINDILDEPPKEYSGTVNLECFNDLTLEDISFKYSASTRFETLKNISINVGKGRCVGIMGESGSGKSTIIKLIGGLYDCQSGNIFINGIELSRINKESLSQILSILPQNPVLFSGSIRDNVVNGLDVSDEQVYHALKLANIYNEISSMPMSIHTILTGEYGTISGGQLQKLLIARALIKKPQLLILDEATSSLDSNNESIINNNLRNEGISQLVISHRISTISNCDYIYFIQNGEIIESGTHKELLQKKGNYFSLYQKQFLKGEMR